MLYTSYQPNRSSILCLSFTQDAMPALTQFMSFLHLFYLPKSRLILLPGQNIPSPFTISLCLSLGADCSNIPVPDTPDTHRDILLCLPIPRGQNCERTIHTQQTEVGTTYKMVTSTIRIHKTFTQKYTSV